MEEEQEAGTSNRCSGSGGVLEAAMGIDSMQLILQDMQTQKTILPDSQTQAQMQTQTQTQMQIMQTMAAATQTQIQTQKAAATQTQMTGMAMAAATQTQTSTVTMAAATTDVKLRTSEMLVRKLSRGCEEARIEAVTEMRLYAKWDEGNRESLARAGAIPVLLDLCSGGAGRHDAKMQEMAVTALLNLSISPPNKPAVLACPGAAQAIAAVLQAGLTPAARANAAALLASLLVDPAVRPLAGSCPPLVAGLLSLLRDGSSRCVGDALRALFALASCPANGPPLVEAGAIPVLLGLVAFGKVKLTQDSLAVLAHIAASGPEASRVLLESNNAIPIILHILDKGLSERAIENAAWVLLNLCLTLGSIAILEILGYKTSIPSIRRLYCSGSERGKSKAQALMDALNVHMEILDVKRVSPHPSSYSMVDYYLVDDGSTDPNLHHHLEIDGFSTPKTSYESSKSSSSKPRKWINQARSLFFSKEKSLSQNSTFKY